MTTDKLCDCAQGRWPCTCMPRSGGEQVAEAIAFDAMLNPPATDIYAETAKAIKGRPEGPRMSREAMQHLKTGGRVRYSDGKEQLLEPLTDDSSLAYLIDQGYLSPIGRFKGDRGAVPDLSSLRRPGFWQRLATDKAKLFAVKCAEFDALNARLQVYRGVALIGWAGFILVLLGV